LSVMVLSLNKRAEIDVHLEVVLVVVVAAVEQ
jgi:hypothetical protein